MFSSMVKYSNMVLITRHEFPHNRRAFTVYSICAFRVGCSYLLRVQTITVTATHRKKERIGAYLFSGACSHFK
jgi:hypothetical protein